MFKADQNQLHQETNQGLIAIRNSEISYYVDVNSAMGTQAALLAGFTYGIFTQNIVNESAPYVNEVSAAYFVAVSVMLAAALHVIINAMLLQVLGPGLALNGPIGSMARAAEGMHIEQGQVIFSFGVMIVAFAVATVLTFWVVMDFWPAMASTIVFVAVLRVSYSYSRRVWLRFYWDDKKHAVDWAERDADDDDEPTVEGKMALEMRDISKGSSNSKGDSRADGVRQASNDQSSARTYSKNSSRFAVFKWLKPSEDEIRDSLTEADRYAAQALTTLQPKDVAMEGYMTKRGVSRTGISGKLVKEPWERRYFVLNGRGQMYYYRNRQDYRTDAVEGRIKARPIELGEYHVVTGADGVADSDTATVTTAITTGGSAVPSFQLTLRPREEEGQSRHWHLRCDTEEVLAEWIAAMNRVSPKSFPAADSAQR